MWVQALQGFQFASGVSYEAPHSPTGAAHSDTFKALKALEELEGAKRDALSELASEAAKLPPDERVKLMKEARTAIGAATSLAGIKSAQSNALTAISEAAGQSKLETTLNADEKREAHEKTLFGEIHALNEKIDRDFDGLKKYTTDKEEAKLEADRIAREKAEEDYQRVMDDPNATEEQKRQARQLLLQAQKRESEDQKAIIDRVAADHPNDPDVKAKVAATKRHVDDRDKKAQEITDARDKFNAEAVEKKSTSEHEAPRIDHEAPVASHSTNSRIVLASDSATNAGLPKAASNTRLSI